MRVLLVAVAVLILSFLISSILTPARSSDIYASPDLSQYYESLRQPDNESMSCCGAADAYYADKVDECSAEERLVVSDCAFIAIVTDDRPDQRRLESGSINRMPIPIGTRIPVPKSKIRKHPVPNPTDHNIIFTKNNWVYCWEPTTLN